ncbi:hypothetical protein HK103_006111 [Boothiomyces macroporosus]|uniref:AB hydrolase-1 domain-containing protein n=1 Tax=Boothiomyces macroporosus TaxID=261099 RepID=A0AAD5Y2X6_9FUNG|nr:hypothetical protein HK103_006111 [Boothiomyces macroporosus]
MKFGTKVLIVIGAYIGVHHLRAYFHRKPKTTVLVKGKKVGYEIHSHDDPMVIFVSGALMSGTCMLPIQRKLGKHSISSLSFDRLGTGRSDSIEKIDFLVYAEHIHQMVKMVDSQSIVLVGHSFGGIGVQYYSQVYGLDPRIKAIILVEPTPADHLIKIKDFKKKLLNPTIIQYFSILADFGIIRFITDFFYSPFYFQTPYSFTENNRFFADITDGYLLRKLVPEARCIGDMFDEASEMIAGWKKVPVKMDVVVGGGKDNLASTPEDIRKFFKDTADRLQGDLYADDTKGHVSILYSDLLFDAILKSCQ